ncbi:hypothetical protein H4696_003434 [Amycolatopsis lexingtonensis]|uniref:Uncharacterized protein n=1 Tax=Amycolatopsis lexingtonensis TaxID=218822 RepID=A0ABR9HZG3_9PSEU|nr:hypothetical protein [Amycolatopsis lexingtonensis]MBE1496334.1 hypothetical protein [Amycolatopsis lexingtonensis]
MPTAPGTGVATTGHAAVENTAFAGPGRTVAPPARHGLLVTSYHLGTPAPQWRATTHSHTLTLAAHDIRAGRSLFVKLIRGDDPDLDPDLAPDWAVLAAARDTENLVLGATPLAAQLRDQLADGAAGLRLLPVPGPAVPLHLLTVPLTTATRLSLERAGFRSADELAVVSDPCWDQLPGFGPKRREVLAHVLFRKQQARPHRDPITRRALLVAGLTRTDVARHSVMIELMARSALPVETARQVCARLAREDIPPVDPEIIAMLTEDDADPALLDHYHHTHRPAVPILTETP